MAEEKKQPYNLSRPGDLWTAEIWNDTQVKIKEDIDEKVNDLRYEIEKKGVKNADNAEHFGRATPEEWMDSFDKRYGAVFAEKNHDHELKRAMFFRTFSKKNALQTINHSFDGIPAIDIYYLSEIHEKGSSSSRITSNDGKNPKLLLLKREEFDDFLESYGSKDNINGAGFRLFYIMEKFNINFKESETLGDVRARLWQRLTTATNINSFSYASSPLIEKDCNDNITIKALKSTGQINNIFLLFRLTKDSRYPIKYTVINNVTLEIVLDLKDLPDDSQVDAMIIVRP
jgi:hypothetical protein